MKKIIPLAAAVSLGISSAALADTPPTNNYSHYKAGGAYLDAGVGFGGMNTPQKFLSFEHQEQVRITEQTRKLRNGVAYRVGFGYLFPVTSHLLLGAEIGYTGYPENNYNQDGYFSGTTQIHTRINYTGHLFDLLGVAKYYFGNHFNIFAKAGIADVYQKTLVRFYDIDAAHTVTDRMLFTKKINKILPEVAAGVGYDFTPSVGVNVTYSHVFGKKPNFDPFNGRSEAKATSYYMGTLTKVASINTVMAGLTFKFNA